MTTDESSFNERFAGEITTPIFHLHEATGPNLNEVFQLFRVRQFRGDIITQRRKKWKIRSNTAMRSGEGGEPTDDTVAAAVAGKLTPVKAVDAFLDRDSWDIGLSQSTCRRRVLSRLLTVTAVKCHKASLAFDTVSRSRVS